MGSGEIQRAIQQLGGIKDMVRIFDAEVKSVSQADRTCEVAMIGGSSSNILTARLMTCVDDGCFYIPEVGSTVVVTMSEYVEPYVSLFSEIDSIVWLGGEYDGVPIVKHPTDTNKGLLKKINNLENKLNSLITKYNNHVHVTSCGAGPGTANTTAQQEAGALVATIQADISHPKITH